MLSLADIFSEEELKDFIMSIKRFLNSSDDIIFTSEPKMDGLSFSALYVNGIFTRGSTRGDGKIGEDITENLKAIRGFPLFLNKEAPEVFEVRGEVFMSKADFLALNQKNEEEHKKTFCESEKCRCRFIAPAGYAHYERTAAQLFGLYLG